MPKYVLLTKIANQAIPTPEEFSHINARISAKVAEECPDVRWIANYTILGPYDYLDIFEAPDNEVAARVALIVRSIGGATTEIWPAVTWERFQEIASQVAS